MMSKIGVFDSGVGGLSVARAIEKALPEHEVIFVNDTKNVPYGTKTPEVLLELVKPIFKNMKEQGCDVIVVACNTVTTTLIDHLRSIIEVPLVGMEPMVKPAAEQTKSGVVAICATPTTLKSKRYKWLKDTYAANIEVVEPDCSEWSYMIESNVIDKQKIKRVVEQVCSKGADVIVLGCTHYHWIEDIIDQASTGKAIVIQPEGPVVEQLNRVLKQLP